VAWMVERYKDTQSDPLLGKPFQELHDLETLDPKPEWQALFEEVCQEMESEFGLKL